MTRKWHDLGHPASLSGLYVKAATKRKISGDRLPDFGLRCAINVDERNLAAYRKLCLFAQNGRLPPTYPHVMAFALQLQLLTAKEFPFPLLGLVHLSNRIRVLRPLGGLSRLHFAVSVENLQPHEKGATCDLRTDAHDSLGLIWSESSRMLCRGMKLDGEAPTVEAPEPLPMTELTRWFADSDIGRHYARICGDYNPIHLTSATAKLFGFPQAIAHGMWTKAMAMAHLRGHLPLSGYEVDVDFHKPVRLPSEVMLDCSEVAPEGQFRLTGHSGLVHMQGAWRPAG